MTGAAVTFDRKISIGTVIQVLAFIGSAIGLWIALDRRVTASEVRVTYVEAKAKDHEDIESKRLDRIEQKIDRLLDRKGER